MIKKSLISLAFVLVFCFSLSPITIAAEKTPIYVTQDEMQSVLDKHNASIDEKNQVISDLLAENQKNQNIIDTLYSIFSTWTTIILAFCALFGIVFPIVLPYLLNRHYNKEIKKLRSEMDLEISKQSEKALMINNALALASISGYSIAVDCLKEIQKNYPEDVSIKIYIAVFSFRHFDMEISQNFDDEFKIRFLKDEKDNLVKTIDIFYEIYEMKQSDIKNKLMIGSIFPKSIIHEPSMIENWLYTIVEQYGYNRHIVLCKKILKIIEQELGIENREGIFDIDQTHVFLMAYKQINYHISVLYHNNRNAQAEEQLRWTIRLYNGDSFQQSEEELNHCNTMLNESLALSI